jgi:acyl-CoA hydrolase
MTISSFFHNLRSAYQAELDDLRTDSEGHDVLRKRLTEKRQELGFLIQMMELSPEMVAVVLHQAFRFTSPAAMDHLVVQDADELPEWESISSTIEVSAWARDIVQTILKEPMGEWFMTIAAALEYMHNKPLTAAERAQVEADDEDGTEDRDDVRNERHDDNHTEDHDEEEADARAREDAGNDWMVEQGFDRKE